MADTRIADRQQEIALLVQDAAKMVATASVMTWELRGVPCQQALGSWLGVLSIEAEAALRDLQNSGAG